MTAPEHTLKKWEPGKVFYFGLAITLLANWIPFIPAWYTFIHMWRVELAASVFLFCTLGYLAFRTKTIAVPLSLSRTELRLIVFPILAFIIWSGASAFWAPSWKSAVHHTLVWSEYLVFYLLIRYAVDQDHHTRNLFRTVTVVLVLFAIPAIIEYVGVSGIATDTQIRGRFAKYGEQIVTVLPFLLIAVVRSSGRKFQIGLAAVGALWLLIYCTAGRINLALFACVIVSTGALIFGLSRFRSYRTNFAKCLAVILLAPIPLYVFTLTVGAPEVPLVSRFADTTGNTYSNDFRKLMNSVSLEMLRSHPVRGVGADNYGMQFNTFREQYSDLNPGDPNLVYGEAGIVGQAHNEYLQIAAELGLVGLALFAWLLTGVAVIAVRALFRLNKNSLFPTAAVLGLGMFLVSSLVSSYSFRLFQNGMVFFIVLAIAAKTLLKDRTETSESAHPIRMPMRPVFAAGILACVLLVVYSGVRVGGAIVTDRANETRDLDQALPLYQLAIRLDDENPDPHGYLGVRLFMAGKYEEAIPHLADRIRIGGGQSANFSYLASAHFLSGDSRTAEETMRTAARLYPRSPFVLTRHAALLQTNGKSDNAVNEFARALEIDPRAANTWWAMINSGSRAASELAFRDHDYLPIMDLQPQRSIYAVIDERYARFPAEKPLFR